MEEEHPTSAEGPQGPEPEGGIPPLPPELSTKEQELRRLVDAGAASPEELRALAAKLEEKRSYEESLWRRDVRPALMQSKKRRAKVDDQPRVEVEDQLEESNEGRIGWRLAILLMVGVVVLAVIAAQASFIWLLVPVVAVLVYVWTQGRSAASPTEPSASPTDATD